MKTACKVVVAVAFMLISGSVASAHHSSAQFDMTPQARRALTGTVKKFEWTNPHVWVFLDVPAAGGKVTTWALEMASPGSLRRSNLRPDSLKAGEKITIEVGPKRDGAPQGVVAGKISFGDGRVWVPQGRASAGGGAAATN